MKVNELNFFGGREDASLILEIIAECNKQLQTDLKGFAVFALCPADKEDIESLSPACVVLSHRDRAVAENKKSFTYSCEDRSADLVALNVQHREHTTSFELLSQSFMGRVYMPKNSKYSQEQILVAAAVLCAGGAPLEKILAVLNELLK